MRQDEIYKMSLLVRNTLFGAFGWFSRSYRKTPDAREVVAEGAGFGDLEHDTEIGADQELGKFYFREFAGKPNVGRIAIEGGVDITSYGDEAGACCLYIDPLDGSLNFARSDDGLCLPYTSIITVYGKREDLTYDDVLVCGLLDLRNGDILIARKLEDGYRTVAEFGRTPREQPVKTRDIAKIDLTQDIAICEPYYADREWIAEAFKGEKGWLRSPGSAAYEMGLVARGVAVLYACLHQKQHEGPGGRALVLGAGGYVCDFAGKNLGPRPVDFKKQDDIILAANEAVARDLLRRLRS